ncbi:MAG: TlpA disulfide reductase family protein [Bacteroidia bacterium]|nr:TlpA disulfide reductase family protein [Bacteroidia bacterium]
MKNRHLFLWLLWTALPFLLSAQVTLKGNLTNCDRDTLYFFEMDGISLRAVAAIPLAKQENTHVFEFSISQPPKGFYLFGGGSQQNTRWMILGDEPEILLRGECPSLSQAKIGNSPDNITYELALHSSGLLSQEFNTLISRYRQAMQLKQNLEGIESEMARLDKKRKNLLDSLSGIDAFVGKVVALRTYLSYQNNKEGYRDEADYFGRAYFQFADLSDPDYNRIPALHEGFISYASTLGAIGLSHENQLSYADMHLSAMGEGSRARKTALLGLVAGFRGKNEDALIHYTDRYLREFPDDNPRLAEQLRQETRLARSKMIGAIAPEIALPSPEGDTLRISDFRGKVLLLDFWASWCGPCRKENPNVVRMYNQYKNKGFEILGISLDRSKEPWVQAIEKDGLTWSHISDLKFWQSIAAKTYSVGSIPYTVLLDAEGRIVAKNLRGAQLEAKVAELLGE